MNTITKVLDVPDFPAPIDPAASAKPARAVGDRRILSNLSMCVDSVRTVIRKGEKQEDKKIKGEKDEIKSR